jgi:ribose transport system substrate-binding protein
VKSSALREHLRSLGSARLSHELKIFLMGEHMKTSFRHALVYTTCLLLLAACKSAGGPSGSGGSSTNLRLAFVTNNASDFWTIARKGTEKADAEFNDLTVEFKIPSDGTAAEQKRLLDDLMAKGVDGIAISPVDPDNQTQMINDAAKQVLIVTQDSDAPSSDRAFYVGTDNVAAGRQAGNLVKEALPQGGKIMIFVGKLDARNARERYQGIKEALQGSNVEIIDIRTDDTDRVRAKSNVSDTIVRYPDIVGLVGLWSYNGPAIVNAVREASKTGSVKIVAFDEEDETLAGVRDGSIYATVVQQPFEFGYQAIKLMRSVKQGDSSAIPAAKQIFVPTLVIKRDGVEEFTKKINQLRGRSR